MGAIKKVWLQPREVAKTDSQARQVICRRAAKGSQEAPVDVCSSGVWLLPQPRKAQPCTERQMTGTELKEELLARK